MVDRIMSSLLQMMDRFISEWLETPTLYGLVRMQIRSVESPLCGCVIETP